MLIQVPLFKQSCECVAISFLIDRILLSSQVYLAYQKVRAWGSPSWGETVTLVKCLLTGLLHARAPIHSYWFLHSKILMASSKGPIFFQINSWSVNVRGAWWLKKVFIYGHQRACLKQQAPQIQNKRSIINRKLQCIWTILFQYNTL